MVVLRDMMVERGGRLQKAEGAMAQVLASSAFGS